MPNPLQTLIEDSIIEGRRTGARQVLRRVVEVRFGGVPDQLAQCIDTADVAELGDFSNRAAVANVARTCSYTIGSSEREHRRESWLPLFVTNG